MGSSDFQVKKKSNTNLDVTIVKRLNSFRDSAALGLGQSLIRYLNARFIVFLIVLSCSTHSI